MTMGRSENYQRRRPAFVNASILSTAVHSVWFNHLERLATTLIT